MQLDDRVTIATPEGVALELVLAGLGSRFLARLLDTVIQVVDHHRARGSASAAANGSGHRAGRRDRAASSSSCSRTTCRSRCSTTAAPIGKVAAGIRVVGDARRAGRLPRERDPQHRAHRRLPARSSTSSASSRSSRREHDQRLGDLAAGTRRRARPLPRPRASAPRADHRAARRGRDVGRVRDRPDDVHDDPAVPRPPARAAAGRRGRTSPSTSPNRLGPRVVGVPPGTHPEYLLEGIVVAKQAPRRDAIGRSCNRSRPRRSHRRRELARPARRGGGSLGAAVVWPVLPSTRRSRARCGRSPASRARCAA